MEADQRTPFRLPVQLMNNPSVLPVFRNDCLFTACLRLPAGWRLGIVGGAVRLDSIAPEIRPEFRQGEAGIGVDKCLAELHSRLAAWARAEIEIFDRSADLLRQSATLVGFGGKKVSPEIHVVSTNKSVSAAIVDQNDMLSMRFALPDQIFLHVDQFD